MKVILTAMVMAAFVATGALAQCPSQAKKECAKSECKCKCGDNCKCEKCDCSKKDSK